MKFVVLNGSVVNPGDLSWDGYRGLGDVTINDDTPLDKVTEQIADAEFILGLPGQTEDLSAEYLSAAPSLRYIGTFSTGYNTIDMDYCHAHGITVCNVPSYGTAMVAQYAVSLLLEVCGHMQLMNDGVHEGKWDESRALVYDVHPLIELDGKTCGIIGFGRIGKTTGCIMQAIGMNVIYNDQYRSKDAEGDTCRFGTLDEVLSQSDVLFLHCPLTGENHHLINEKTISLMKDGAILINNARGQLVDEKALADALNSGKLYAAGLDVTEIEPVPSDSPLLTARNCLITPHMSWLSRESRQRIIDTALDNVKRYLAGHPVNVVS